MTQSPIKPETLLAQLEDLMCATPPIDQISCTTDINLAWLGTAAAIIEQWNIAKTPMVKSALDQINDPTGSRSEEGFRELMVLLHQARSTLRMRTIGPTNVTVAGGAVYDYFQEVRKIITLANIDLFFIDPYLDGSSFLVLYLKYSPVLLSDS